MKFVAANLLAGVQQRRWGVRGQRDIAEARELFCPVRNSVEDAGHRPEIAVHAVELRERAENEDAVALPQLRDQRAVLARVRKLQKALVEEEPGPRLAAAGENFRQQRPVDHQPRRVVGAAEQQKLRLRRDFVKNVVRERKAVFPAQRVKVRHAADGGERRFILRKGRDGQQCFLWLQCQRELKDQLRRTVCAEDVPRLDPEHFRKLLPQRAAVGVGVGGDAPRRLRRRCLHRLGCAEGVDVD